MKSRHYFLRTIVSAFVICLGAYAEGQTFTTLHSFTNGIDGGRPHSAIISADGILYGAAAGGDDGAPNGEIFSIRPDGSDFTVIFTFDGTNGSWLTGDLVFGGANLFGTALSGTNFSPHGEVFKVNTNGANFSILRSFDGTNGSGPGRSLIFADNALYGTTFQGGVSNNGTIFRMNSDGSDFSKVHDFTGGTDGSFPTRLVLAGDTLYGTTAGGGISNLGTVFAIKTNGAGFTNLHHFIAPEGTAANLCLISNDTAYGFAENGGVLDKGTLFSIKTNGSHFTNLHFFATATNDARYPSSLILSGNNLFGTTQAGVLIDDDPNVSRGSIFRIGTNGSDFKILYNFSPLSFEDTNNDGSNPNSLIFLEEALYGVAPFGGTAGYGTVFSLSLSGPQLKVLRSDTNVILSWRTNEADFVLQSTTNLVSPIWETNLPVPVIVNGQFTVTNSISGTQKFYRLSQ